MYMPNADYKRFATILNCLRFVYGALLLFSGLDKLLELSDTQWASMISPVLEYGFAIKLSTILMALSVSQMTIGFMLVIPRLSRLGAYLASLLLFLMSANLFTAGFHFSRALLNLMLGIGMLVLGQLLGIKEGMRNSAA